MGTSTPASLRVEGADLPVVVEDETTSSRLDRDRDPPRCDVNPGLVHTSPRRDRVADDDGPVSPELHLVVDLDVTDMTRRWTTPGQRLPDAHHLVLGRFRGLGRRPLTFPHWTSLFLGGSGRCASVASGDEDGDCGDAGEWPCAPAPVHRGPQSTIQGVPHSFRLPRVYGSGNRHMDLVRAARPGPAA